MKPFDLLVIGGGINGAGIARDAAGRGLSVLLAEQGDLGEATSSRSTKLIHGGLRYLEHYDFRLVRHALTERETLMGIAPHIIWPLRFVLPHRKGLRPAWLLRLGLFLYDHLGGRKMLPATRTLRLKTDPAGAPLRAVSGLGFEYSDAWVQDNRLVVLNARDAAAKGAEVLPRTKVTSARRDGSLWRVALAGGRQVLARAIVNAAGPWVASVITDVAGLTAPAKVRLVQGSHIVVRKLYDHDRCYIFQNTDGRIFFAIPYEDDFTLIGTTDRDFNADPAQVDASAEEIAYLTAATSSYFRREVTPADVVWSYSGVRPLYDNGAARAQETTRDYVLNLDSGPGAPILSVFGGKITTYRCLAEDALDRLTEHFPDWGRSKGWTARHPLPGGDFPAHQVENQVRTLQGDYPFLTEKEVRRLIRHYGTEARDILGTARTRADLGATFGGPLTEAEVRFLMTREYARTADDVVWRRTKAGLVMTQQEIAALDAWIVRERGGTKCQ